MRLWKNSWLTGLETGQMNCDPCHPGYFYLGMEKTYEVCFGLCRETWIYPGKVVYPEKEAEACQVKAGDQRSKEEFWRKNWTG